LRIREGNNKV